MKKNLTIGNRQTGETLTMLVSEEENCGTLQPAYGIPSAKFLPMEGRNPRGQRGCSMFCDTVTPHATQSPARKIRYRLMDPNTLNRLPHP